MVLKEENHTIFKSGISPIRVFHGPNGSCYMAVIPMAGSVCKKKVLKGPGPSLEDLDLPVAYQALKAHHDDNDNMASTRTTTTLMLITFQA